MMNNDNIRKWRVIEEEDVSPSHWFPLLRHTVELPNGHQVNDYYFAPLGDVVMVMPVTKNNEIILVRQYKHGLGEILTELPGGMQQKNKGVIESALAELEEETGVSATADRLIPLGKVANNTTKTKQVTYGFILFDAEINTTQKQDVTENIDVFTKPAAEVLRMAMNEDIYTTDSLNFIFKAALRYPELFGVKELF